MIVVVLRKYKPSCGGLLSRWFLQIAPGVFIGDLSARVVNEIEVLLHRFMDEGYFEGATLALHHPTGNALEGFTLRELGESRYRPVDDGEGLFGTVRKKRVRKTLA